MKSVKNLESVKTQVAQLNGKVIVGGITMTEYVIVIAPPPPPRK
jgi:hypothetical protein